jgi:hypothetical protein
MTSMQVPCSRSAHDENVLARRPQWDLHGCHSQREKRASLEGALMRNVLAWDKSASRRARGWAGEIVARSKGQPGYALCKWKYEKESKALTRASGWAGETVADRAGPVKRYPVFFICSSRSVCGWGMISTPFLPWCLTR